MWCYGSYIILLVIASRIEAVHNLFSDSHGLVTIAGTGYVFGFICQCMSVGSVCIIRDKEAPIILKLLYLVIEINVFEMLASFGSDELVKPTTTLPKYQRY